MSKFHTASLKLTQNPDSPVLIHVPHASTAIPPEVRSRILLSDDDLVAELAESTDMHTDKLAWFAAQLCETPPTLAVNRLSRLVVDPERLPDDQEELAAVGRGAVYTRACNGAPLRDAADTAHVEQLMQRYHEPYAIRLEAIVELILKRHDRAVIIDLHSYPSAPSAFELNQTGPRPEICIGTDDFHTPTALARLAEASYRYAGFTDIGFNSPYSGTYVPLAHFGKDRRVESVMIELRRDFWHDRDGNDIYKHSFRCAQGIVEMVRALQFA